MAKLKILYLVERARDDGSSRYYFAPKHPDKKHGWGMVRLHDEYERPITTAAAAATACRAIVAIYQAWRAGDKDAGPHRIDKLGRVIGAGARSAPAPQALQRHYLPGHIGAMVQDYLGHRLFLKNKLRTQIEYRTYLNLFVAKFGELHWRRLAPGAVREWLELRGDTSGKSGARSLHRTVAAFFSAMAFVYTDVDHPGYVRTYENPMRRFRLQMDDSPILIWPAAALDEFVALADELGEHSIADGIVIMSWLGVRKQDWLDWPANYFDDDLLAFSQRKTSKANVLPWREATPLIARVAAAKLRRQAAKVTPTTFFCDSRGKSYTAQRFRDRFNDLRRELAARRPSFPARHYVGLIDGSPMAMPSERLAMRTLRHTCVTRLFDAGIAAENIGGVTGHTTTEINDILNYYRAQTADQARTALRQRAEHQGRIDAKAEEA